MPDLLSEGSLARTGHLTQMPVIFPEPRQVVVRFVTLQVGSTGSMLKDYSNWTMNGQCAVDGPPDGDLDEPQGHVAPFLQQRVAQGAWPINFSQTIYASDDETITCTAGGTYTRGLLGSSYNLGASSTGPIAVRGISGTIQRSMPGREAETVYDVAWTATKQ